jgi:hypothetical protein
MASPFTPCQTCRHCQQRKVNRPRGLCWRCYYAPGVREKFGPVNAYGRRGVGGGTGVRSLPPTPTTHPPGSVGKLLVLEARARDGVVLWHPLDADESGELPVRVSSVNGRGRRTPVRPTRTAVTR